MNKEQFLAALSDALWRMPEPERITTLKYFAEVIGDRVDAGQSEEEAVAALGTPEEIAARLESENGFAEETFSASFSDSASKEPRQIHRVFSGIRTRVQIRVCNQPIEVVRGNSDVLQLDFVQLPGERYEIQEKDGGLCLVQSRTAKMRNPFRLCKQFVRVSLPIGYDGSADFQTSNASIRVTDGSFDRLRLGSSNGALHVLRLTAQTLEMGTSNGSLRLIQVGARRIEGETTNGSVEATETSSAGLLSLSTTNGRISLNCVAGQNIRLQSSNGSIRGEIEGVEEEYSVSACTSNGRSNLSQRKGGAKSLTALTSNANIDVSFSGRKAPGDENNGEDGADSFCEEDPWFTVDEQTGEVYGDEPEEDDDFDDESDDDDFDGDWREIGRSMEEWGREFSCSMREFGKDLKHSLKDLERQLKDMFG